MRYRLVVPVALLLVSAAVLWVPPSAFGADDYEAVAGQEDVTAQVGGSPGAGGSTGASGSGGSGGSGGSAVVGANYTPSDEWCLQFGAAGAADGCTSVPHGAAAPAADPSPELLAIAARETLEYVMPEPMTSPPKGGFQLVAIKTWMYMDKADWHPVSATATAGAVSATVTATPTTMTWDMGEGDPPVVCNGPGEPWQRGHEAPCGYVYDYHGDYTITVTVAWKLKWVASNGTVGLFADRELTTTFPLNVQEAQAVTD